MRQWFWVLLLFPCLAGATVSTETLRSDYDCNGTQDTYTYAFQIYEDDDLLVIVKDSSGAEETLTLDVDYTVTGAGDASGTIVLTAATDCASGETLALVRNIELQQSTDYVDGELFSAESMETALDKLTLLTQQQEDEITRSVRFPPGTGFDGELPENSVSGRAGKVIGFDSSGEITIMDATDIAASGSASNGIYYVSTSAAITDHGDDTVTGSLATILDSLGSDPAIVELPADTTYVVTTAITNATDNLTIRCQAGAEIEAGAASMWPLTLSGDYVTIEGCKFVGEGTFVTDQTGYTLIFGLVKLTGDHATVRNSHFLNPETTGLLLNGDYATVENNIFEGGDYFADSTAIGSDRQHYAVNLNDSDYTKIIGNRIIPNSDANAGAPIQGIEGNNNEGVTVANNYIYNVWDNSIYLECQGCEIVNNTTVGQGIKIPMDPAATAGNVISGNNITVDRISSPLKGGNGLILNNARWTTVSDNTIGGAYSYGILMNTNGGATAVDYNCFTGNVVYGVDGGGASGVDAVGFYVASVDTWAYNVLNFNIFSDIGQAGNMGDRHVHAIYINPDDTANNVGNKISNNIVEDVYEYGLFVNNLTDSEISNNSFSTTNIGTADSVINNTGGTRVRVHDNYMVGDGTQMEELYLEASGASNIVENNIAYNLPASKGVVNASGLATSTTVRNNSDGRSDVQAYSTASARTITAYELYARTQMRDPAGAARTDTTPTATALITSLIPGIGSRWEVKYINTADADEAITLAGGANVTLLGDDFVLDQGDVAQLTFVNIDGTNVSCEVKKSINNKIVHTASALYDFSVHGGTASTIALDQVIPDNSTITRAWYEVISAMTSGGAATVSLGHADDAAGIQADLAFNNAVYTEGYHDGLPDGTAANFTTKTTADRRLAIVISSADLTAGKIRIWCEYVTSE